MDHYGHDLALVHARAYGRHADNCAPGILELLVLPDDPMPAAAAIVSVGHAISYLPDAAAVDRALARMAAVRPGHHHIRP